MAITKSFRRLRIKRRIRKKISGTTQKPRLSVFKSNTTITAQLIDDESGRTLAHASSKEVSDARSVNISSSKEVGDKIAERAAKQGIKSIVFDRNGYAYHGKIKALAEAVREKGINF